MNRNIKIGEIMLKPQQNNYRDKISLDGIWKFKVDTENIGIQNNWHLGLSSYKQIAVPSSWNEIDSELSDYIGVGWYESDFYVSRLWDKNNIYIRFASVTYHCTLWINGQIVGTHDGGHLPFEFNISEFLQKDHSNKIVVRVENELSPLRVPPGNVDTGSLSIFMNNIPRTNYDFFPYAGIDRTVTLFTLPSEHISDITVNTNIKNNVGLVDVIVNTNVDDYSIYAVLDNGDKTYKSELSNDNSLLISVDNPNLWSVKDPHLYNLKIFLENKNSIIDTYELKIGIRTIEVKGDQIYLNGEKIEFKGFGRHEESPITGRAQNLPQSIMDHNLLKWIGANSYRTAHYPYSEEDIELADANGFLVINEIPAVGLFFDDIKENIDIRLELCRKQINTLINRDKNHPSVVMWSVANEPFPLDLLNRMKDGKNGPADEISTNFLNTLIEDAKTIDNSRPVTLAAIHGTPLDWLENVDVILLNRYYGWYFDQLDLDGAIEKLSNELSEIHDKTKKPIIISEFGADTIPGFHSVSDELYTEEYQLEYWKRYLEYAKKTDYVVGLHAWVLADFRTTHSTMRIGGLNHKGAFTRDRKPKMSAHYLRSEWKN